MQRGRQQLWGGIPSLLNQHLVFVLDTALGNGEASQAGFGTGSAQVPGNKQGQGKKIIQKQDGEGSDRAWPAQRGNSKD